MTRRPQSKHILAALAAGFTVSLWPGGAVGEPAPVCVRCTAPVQNYLCALTGVNTHGASRAAGLHCAARLAQEYGHSTCAVARNEVSCDGDYRHYVLEQGTAEAAAFVAPDEDAPGPDVAEPDGQDAANRKGPPETVVELTRETARKTEESLKTAADRTAQTTRGVGESVRDAAAGAARSVGRATRKTIKCIGSLFNDC